MSRMTSAAALEADPQRGYSKTAGRVPRLGGVIICSIVTLAFLCAPIGALSAPGEHEELLQRASELLKAKQHAEADALFRRAAEQAAASAAAAHDQELRAQRGRLMCLDSLGARAELGQVLKRVRAIYGAMGQPLLAALTALDIGRIEADLGRHSAAQRTLEGALKQFVDARKYRYVGEAHVRIANAYMLQGRYARALEHVDAALRIFTPESRHRRSRAEALNILGILHTELGDVDRALAAYNEALEFFGAEDVYEEAGVHLNVGVAEYGRGELEKALEQIELAHDAYAQIGAKEALARSLTQWGFALGRAGRHAEALQRLRAAVELAGADAVGAAYAKTYVADALMATKAWQEASKLFAATLEVGKRLGDRQLQCHVERGLADVLIAQGRPKEALPHVRRSVGFIDAIVAGLGPVAGAFGRSRRAATFDTAVRAGFASRDAELAFEYLEMSRARSLLTRLGMGDVIQQLPLPNDIAKRETAARRGVIAAKVEYAGVRRTGRRSLIRKARDRRHAAELAYEGVVADIQRFAQKSLPRALPKTARLAHVAAGLEQDQCMVLFGVTDSTAHALVVGANKEPRLVNLGPASALRKAVADLDVRGLDAIELEEAVATTRRLILDPLKLSESVRRVLVSPDGPIAHVPLRLLADERDFSFIPSASVYGVLRRQSRGRGSKMFAAGDPAYSMKYRGRTVSVYAGSGRLSQLSGTRKEIEAIRRPGDKVLLGKEATEGAVRSVLGAETHWDTIVFACHGIANERRPHRSGLVFTPGAGHDGFLSTVELFGLRLSADLVVLSACESGRGTALQGEGMLGLASAFMYAGAPRLVASLWKVDDEATKVFMETLHRAWRGTAKEKRVPISVALRRAADHVRAQPRWKHPKYWAAWVIWGVSD